MVKMSQQINLLCLVLLAYFFLPVLSEDEKDSVAFENRFLPDSTDRYPPRYQNPRDIYGPNQMPVLPYNPDLPPYPAPMPYPAPRPYPAPMPNPGQPGYPSPGQYPSAPPTGQGAIPPNPCPNIFRYVRNLIGKMEGRITVPFNPANILDLSVNVSMQGYYGPKANLGLKILTSAQDIYQKTAPTLLYQLTFPTQESIPRITHVDLNGVEYCRGPEWERVFRGPPVSSLYATLRVSFVDSRNLDHLLDDDDMNLADDEYTFSDNEVQYA